MKKLFLFMLTVFLSGTLFAQTKVTGKVTSLEDGEPIIGANVVVQGTQKVTFTNLDGEYTIDVPADATLVFSFIGYMDQVVPVNGRAVINVTMQQDAVQLEEAIVVAYGTAKKESITGAVSSVNSKSIEKRPVSNAISALEGMTTGVQINNSYGEPGATPTIRIRGYSSINGDNDPLYVVDGVPLSGSTNDINPQDIESLTILKDAASAAMYGNRAANGVVLITTKRGKSERFTVRASTQQGVYTRGIPEYDRMNADEWMESVWKATYNGILSTPSNKFTPQEAVGEATSQFWDKVIYNIYNKGNNELFDANGKLVSGAQVKPIIAEDLDWYEPIERLGHRQEYNISGDGATEKSNFFFSVNYTGENGYLKTSDFERYTARVNASIQPKKWIKLGINLNGSHRVSNYTSQSSSTGYANPFYFARNMAPIYPVYVHDLSSANGDYVLDAEGNRIYDYGQYETRPQNNGRNVIYEGELNLDDYHRNTVEGLAYADITFLKDFKFSIKGNLFNSNSEERTYDNAIVGDGKGSNGRASRTLYRYRNYTFQQQLTWNKTFNKKHDAEVFLGHENYHLRYNYLYAYKTGETFANKYDLVNFANMTSLTDYENNYATEGYIARAKYAYDNRYFFEASFRRDGSSRFYKENRWGNFWSIGGSWMISRENFMKDADWVNDLKFRASYGEVGNDQSVGMYGYMALYGLGFNGIKPSAYKTQNEARDIVWESTNSMGIALEGRFFDRFNLSVEYYDKVSHDLLFDVILPLSAGAESTGSSNAKVTQNLGDVSNRGWELNFDIDLMRGQDFIWKFGFNASTLKNKILTLPEQNRKDGIINGTKRYVEGGGIYDFWMFQTAGIDQMTGRTLYIIDDADYYVDTPANDNQQQIPSSYVTTINGKHYTTTTSYAKKDWEGSAIPDLFGSFNTSLNWKNLSFSALFTYQLGGKTMDYSYQGIMSSGGVGAMHTDLLNAWDGVPAGMTETSPNRIDPNGIPALDAYYSSDNNSTADRWLQDASYLVVKNISLGYRLPERICNKLDLSAININLGVENLATITSKKGMNPQYSFGGTVYNYFTTARTFSLGINITL